MSLKPRQSESRGPAAKRMSVTATVAIVVLVAGYVLLRPMLERRLGIQLPHVLEREQAEPDARGPDVVTSDKNDAGSPRAKESGTRQDSDVTGDQRGSLRDVGRDVLVSPAGLRYTRGSLEGHRLKHIMQHAKDKPDRPGSHGVFEGGQNEIVAVIDEAYLLAKQDSRRARLRREDGRQIYTVDMQRRIGYVGGQSGQRAGHPPARHVRLVLEDDRIITAYPLKQ